MVEGGSPTHTSFVTPRHTDGCWGGSRQGEELRFLPLAHKNRPPQVEGIAQNSRNESSVQGARTAGRESAVAASGAHAYGCQVYLTLGAIRGVRGARGRERAGPTRSHPEPGRDPAQRRRVLWGRLHGRRGRRGHPAAPMKGSEKTKAARLSRGGAAVARWAHNPKVGGSNPSPATRKAGTNWYRPFSVYAIMRARKESDRQLGTCDFGLRGRSGIPETLRWLRPSWWLALS
jgi:hypothetical protein